MSVFLLYCFSSPWWSELLIFNKCHWLVTLIDDSSLKFFLKLDFEYRSEPFSLESIDHIVAMPSSNPTFDGMARIL